MTYDWKRVSPDTGQWVVRASVRLADAIDSDEPVPPGLLQDRLDAMNAARAEALVPPLRTRAEVDAEIAQFFRDRERRRRALGLPRVHGGIHFSDTEASKLLDLCAEPLAPEPVTLAEARRNALASMPDPESHPCVPTPDPDECERGGDCIESIARPGHCAKCEREMPCRAVSPAGTKCLLARGHTMAHDWHGSTPDPCSCDEALGLREKLRVTSGLLTAIELDIHHALVNLK
jgi:hypothetical protein